MYDLTEKVWAQAKLGQLKGPLTSREKSVFFAPPSTDGYKERAQRHADKCEVRKRAAQCVRDLCAKYSAEFVEWVDGMDSNGGGSGLVNIGKVPGRSVGGPRKAKHQALKKALAKKARHRPAY